MLIQFRISDKDETLQQLIRQLEYEGRGKRGYVGNKLRDMIKAYHLLSEHTGELDPYKLMLKIASGTGRVEEEKKQEQIAEVAVDATHWAEQFASFN